ncbi:MAG: hypothetical protein K9H64_00935 [Bacteroidales bacterium]|nr:hypothetical protein [Bacteroidales bacterium]MCF8454783.1 hypothetical protein [Bacteroidales bacterium]
MKISGQEKIKVYLIPGQGSDNRVFEKIQIDHHQFDTVNVKYILPERNEKMPDYAGRLMQQIDTSHEFILIGYSLGGMLASEISTQCSPKMTILIASAKCRKELPFRYRFMKYIPIYRIIPAGVIKGGGIFIQPKVDRIDMEIQKSFTTMIKEKDPKFLKRTIHMIATWPTLTYSEKCIHIHGEKDHTLPIRNVKYDYVIKGATHKMILTDAEEINKILDHILNFQPHSH